MIILAAKHTKVGDKDSFVWNWNAKLVSTESSDTDVN